jgi:hypothetical protein
MQNAIDRNNAIVHTGMHSLLVRDRDLARVDAVDNVVRRLTVDGAADGLCGTEDLLAAVRERLRECLGAHRPCDLDHLVERDVARVLDVLLLLAVTGWLWRRERESGGLGRKVVERKE